MNEERLQLVREFRSEKGNLLDIGMRSARRIAVMARVEALRAYGGPGDVVGALTGTLGEELQSLIEDAMVAGHLAGRLRGIRTATGRLRQQKQGYSFGPYDNTATQFVKTRLKLTEAEMNTLRTMYSDTAVFVTREVEGIVERKAQLAVQKIVEEGMHVKAGMVHLRNSMSKIGISADNPWLIENIVRTQIALSYSAGRWNFNNQDPDVQEILWGYEYMTVGDERVRPSHAGMEGARYPKDHAFWDSNFPPNGFSCRCEAVEIFNEDREAKMKELPETVEVEGAAVTPQADEGWQHNPGRVYQDMITTTAVR